MNSLTKLNFQQLHLEHNLNNQTQKVHQSDTWGADVVFQKIHNSQRKDDDMAILTLNATPLAMNLEAKR